MSPKNVFYAVVVAAVVFQVVLATETANPADAKEKLDNSVTVAAAPAAQTSPIDGLMNSQNVMQWLTQSGVVALGVVGVAAVAALAMPMFGIRYCQLFNTCETGYSAYSNNAYQNDMYNQYQQSYPSSNTYQKRSVDIYGPMLHMLKSAYDKYGQAQVKTS